MLGIYIHIEGGSFYCSAFNNVFSNIGYIMLGFLFLLLVLRRYVH